MTRMNTDKENENKATETTNPLCPSFLCLSLSFLSVFIRVIRG
jgi:hypothetical protein